MAARLERTSMPGVYARGSRWVAIREPNRVAPVCSAAGAVAGSEALRGNVPLALRLVLTHADARDETNRQFLVCVSRVLAARREAGA